MKSIGKVKKLCNELNYMLLPQHKRKVIPLFVCGVVSAFLELFGITIILPFIQVITEPDKVMNNNFIKPVLNHFGITDARNTLILVGIFIIILYIVKNVYMVLYIFFQNAFSSWVYKDLSVKMLNAYLKRPYVYYTNTSYAEVSRGTLEDTWEVYTVLNAIVGLITQILYFSLIAIYILVTEPFIAIGVVVLLAITMFFMVVVFKPIVKRLGKKNIIAQTDRNSIVYQIVQGVKEIYASDKRSVFSKKYDIAAEKARKTVRNYGFISAMPDRIVEGICVSGLIGVILLRLLDGTDMTTFIPRLAVFAMATFKMLPAIGGMTGRINDIIYALPRIENVYNIINDADKYFKTEELMEKHTIECNDTVRFENTIKLSHVYWKYDRAEKPILIDVCLEIKKGKCIGIIGQSGSGKTTLIDVILGLYKPQKGSVSVDGVDIYAIPHAWAKIVSYVQQTVFLIDDTVRANVAFGIDDVDDNKIWTALDRASLGDFIRSLPDGLDTMVGERGVKFSGGQRQRIAIARALYDNPEVLILDEATAALDNETEKAVMESIDMLQGQVTMIIVAHRLTTIKNCDKIYSIENGIAVEKNKEDIGA